MIQCSLCRKHVHSSCDPEATEEKILERRASQYNYMYVCKVCKGNGQVKGPGAMAGNSMAAPLSRAYDDPSPVEVIEDTPPGPAAAGAGRGKPLNSVAEARKKLLTGSSGAVSRPKPGYTWSAQQGLPGPAGVATTDLASTLAEKKKRVAEIRARRGRTPKYKGMVGLSKPQGDPSLKEEDVQEESKMIICSLNDEFVLKQDICVMCGSLGNDLEGRLICCAQCGQCYHPHCVNVKVTKIILQKGWRCLDCTVCEGCGKKHDEANLILCDDCDISYHIYCTDPPLDHVPDGAWKCKWCSVCQYCGTNSPGTNSGWFENYSTCGPCMSLQQCPLCEEGYEDGELIVTCATCNRWCHGECDSIHTEEEAEKCFEAGYMCQLCRPDNSLPPHLAMRDEDEREHLAARKALHRPPSPPMSPDYPVYGGYYNTASYMLDGVMLSERGMQHLKSLTIEKDKRMRKRRLGPESMFNPLEAGAGASHDNSLEGEDDDDDEAPPPTPGVPGTSGTHKDGEIVKPLPDGSAPEPPEGFTIVVKDNGLMVLRKRRYRDLKKVGIGGFQAKVRTPKGQAKGKQDEELDDNDPNKPKKRVAWRPKKNKILVQYPEYIQDAFFGKDFMAKCPDKMDDDEALPSPDKRRVHSQEDGKTIHLNKDALSALEEMKAKEEAERKEREAKEEEARAAIEAAAKVAADKARIAQEELEALKKEALEDDSVVDKKGVKEEEKTEDEDLMLPSDLFGDDIFSMFKGEGADIDIDDSALDEAEEVDGEATANDQQQAAMDVNKELSEGLQEMLGPEFNAKDMEDIFNIAASDTSKDTSDVRTEVKSEDVKTEPTEALPGATPDTMTTPMSIGETGVKQEAAPATPVSGQEMMPPPSLPATAQDPAPAGGPDPATTANPGQAQQQQQRVMNSTETFSGQMLVPRLATSVQGGPEPGLPSSGTVGQVPQPTQPAMSMPMSMSGMQPAASSQPPTMTTQVQPGAMPQQQQQPQRQMMPQQQQQPRMMQQGMGERPPMMQQPQPGIMQQSIVQSTPQQLQPGMPQPQQQQMQPGMQQRQQLPPGMQQQQIQSGIQQQLQPGMQQRMQQPQPGMQQQQMQHGIRQQVAPGMQQQMAPGMQQQQQMGPGFVRQQGPMLQQQQMIGQQQMMGGNMMPGQRMVMQQQQLMPGQMMPRGQLGPGGQMLRGPMVAPPGPGGQMQQQPGQQPMGAAGQPAPATKEPSSTAQSNLQKWEADEPLGENATIAMILYANVNHANLKVDYPKWEERIKQIAKIWKNLPNEKRAPYVTKARENRTANRMNRGPVSTLSFLYLSQVNRFMVTTYIHCYLIVTSENLSWF